MSVLIALSRAPLSPTAKINLLWKQKQVSEGGTRFPRMDQDWQSTYQYTEDSAFFFFFFPACLPKLLASFHLLSPFTLLNTVKYKALPFSLRKVSIRDLRSTL